MSTFGLPNDGVATGNRTGSHRDEQDGHVGMPSYQNVKSDMLLLDMCLPDVSAVNVIRQARHLGIPVLAYSGMASWKQEALEAGCAGFLEKPFSVRQVIEFIDTHVRTYS